MRVQTTVLALLLLVAAAIPAAAQRTTASIRGTVTDSTGGVVPGADVTVKGTDTGLSQSAVTNADGVYQFSELPVGTYSIEVTISGFKSAVQTGIALNVADQRTVNITLETGAVSETVTVTSPAVAVQTVGGEVAGLVTGEQVRELPLNGRNFLQLTTLMPGVSAGNDFNTKDRGLMSGISLAVSGSGLSNNMWMVDGANNNDVGSNRTILVFPSVDAIEEFKVHRNSYSAEFGGASGAQVNIVTRSGTNDFHGSGYYFGRNDALASTDYFLKQAGQPKGPLSINDFGGTIGGPIMKDRLHFFWSEEWNREKRGITRATFVPTDLERVGDFSGPEIPDCSSPSPIDPLTGAAFPGNKIPADRLSPAGLLIMKLYPSPNTTPGPGSCNNWVTAVKTPINWRQENGRVDYTFTNNLRMMVRYTQDSWTNPAPSAVENLWGDDPFPAVDSNWDQPGRSLTAQLNQNLGSAAVNTVTFAYSANVITVTRGGLTPSLNDDLNAAIPTIFPDSVKEYGANRGHAIIDGRGSYPDTLSNMAPFKNNQNLFVWKDDFSIVRGTHFLKAGVTLSFNQKNEDVFDWGSGESPEFGDSVGFTGNGDNTGNVLADLLLRGMAFGFNENSADRSIRQRWHDQEAYVADSWKLRPSITVDYGLRWSRFEAPFDVGDTISSFDPAYFNPALGSDACNGLLLPPGSNACAAAGFQGGAPGPNRQLAKTNNYFAPRLGVAWDVQGNGKTIVRSGLGQFYERESLQGGLNLGFNPPFNQAQLGSRTLDSNVEPFPGAFATNQGIPIYGLDTSGKMGYNWQYNVSIGRELTPTTTIEIGYVGSIGRRLLRPYDVNQVPLASRLAYIQTGSDSDARAALRPFGVFGDENIQIFAHGGSTNYNSLQTQLISRFAPGSQFQASYTWSKTLGDVPLNGSEFGISGDTQSVRENPGLDYGLTQTHREHIFNASLVLALPDLASQPSAIHHIFGSWEVGTIVQAQTGTPLTVFVGSVPDLSGVSGTGFAGNERPNRVAGIDCRATSGPKEQWLNPDAWTLNDFQLGTFGNSGRSICTGPGFAQMDLAFYKNIPLGHHVKGQFRFEIFNVTNRVNFTGVDTSLNPTSITLDTGDIATATKIVGYTPSGSFGSAGGTRDPRQAQFGFKITF